MPRVYVVQDQHKWDREAGRFVPKFDLSSAETFGELAYLLTPTAAPFRPEPVVDELRDKLVWFSDDDYLLLIGNPVLIGCAMAVAAQVNGGRVRVLQWSGKDQRYVPVLVNLAPDVAAKRQSTITKQD